MKLDKPTTVALLVFASALLALGAGTLSHEIALTDAISKAQYLVMSMLVSLGVISHGTPSETTSSGSAKLETPKSAEPVAEPPAGTP